MNELEEQKRQLEGMLVDLAEDHEQMKKIKEEILKFETWASSVRPFLTDPAYLENATYEDLRLAVRILGVHVTV